MRNRMEMLKKATVAASLIASATLATSSHAGTFGNDLLARGSAANNNSTGNDYVLNTTLAVGEVVDTWGIFNDSATVIGNEVTPFLAVQTGTVTNTAAEEVPVFEIIAVGLTRTIDDSGAQTWAFDVQSGSGVIGAGTYFGWRDGGVSEASKGGSVTEYDNGLTPPDVRTWFSHGSTLSGNPVAIGTEVPTRSSHAISVLFDRTYSAQVTTIPEPASLALLGLGGVMIMRRRPA